MKIRENQNLARFTTFKMGGECEKVYIPENIEELVACVDSVKPDFIIGGGSNLLINDEKKFESVVLLRNFNKKIEQTQKDGEFIVGASVSLQALLKYINDKGYGGIEYLYSVPGLVGGAVFMNAGRGKSYNKTISDYIVSVTFLDSDNKIQVLKKDECYFGHRKSIFQTNKGIILETKFSFEKGSPEKFSKLKQERIEHCKKVQDMSLPNFGSVFCESNGRILKFIKLFSNEKDGIYFSKKTTNWLLNNNGNFKQAIKKIKRIKKIHTILGKDCKVEVRVIE